MSSLESQFLEDMEDVEQYSGLWIAILDYKVIAKGEKIEDVHAKAVKVAKDKTALFVAIPDKNKEQTLIL